MIHQLKTAAPPVLEPKDGGWHVLKQVAALKAGSLLPLQKHSDSDPSPLVAAAAATSHVPSRIAELRSLKFEAARNGRPRS